jgi:hypothetical protein
MRSAEREDTIDGVKMVASNVGVASTSEEERGGEESREEEEEDDDDDGKWSMTLPS